MITWVKRLFNKNKQDKWTVIKGDNKAKFVLSPEVTKYFESQLPNPKQENLIDLIKSSQKVTIYKRRIKNINIEPYEVEYSYNKLIEVVSQDKIKELGEKLEIESNRHDGYLLDNGSIIFDFVLKNNTIQQIEFLEFTEIRWKNKWKDDAVLKDHVSLLNWFDKNGIEEPLNTYNKLVRIEEKEIEAYNIKLENWERKAPEAILLAIDKGYCYNYDKVYLKLKKDFSDDNEIILSLFNLYGCGFGVWNGFPSYESIPEKILLKFSTQSFIEIENMFKLTEEQKHGMARFFSGSSFCEKRKTDVDKLPVKLKNLLLEHLITLGDEDKINQFKETILT